MSDVSPKTKRIVSFVVIMGVTILLISQSGMGVKQNEELTQASIVGRCFDNGMKAVGKLIYVENRRWGLLAFASGVVGRYPFEALEPALCPGGDQPLDKDQVLEILKKSADEE